MVKDDAPGPSTIGALEDDALVFIGDEHLLRIARIQGNIVPLGVNGRAECKPRPIRPGVVAAEGAASANGIHHGRKTRIDGDASQLGAGVSLAGVRPRFAAIGGPKIAPLVVVYEDRHRIIGIDHPADGNAGPDPRRSPKPLRWLPKLLPGIAPIVASVHGLGAPGVNYIGI